MGPARQRFDADHAAAVGGDHRLVVHVECLALDRDFEFAQEKAALGMLLVDLRHEAPHRAAPGALGGAQRQRGVTAELVAGGAVLRRLRDADAGADLPQSDP